MSQEFFKALCQVNEIDFKKASKIIDGRYRPFLSGLDDQYYQGNDVWDAKVNALNAAIKKLGVEGVRSKLATHF